MRSAGLAALGGCWDGSLQGQLGVDLMKKTKDRK